MKNSQVGDLLVASTLVEGTVLERGVCLLVHEDQDRAFGVLLNRPMQVVATPEPQDDGKPETLPSRPASRLSEAALLEASPQSPPAGSGIDKSADLSNQSITVVGPKNDPAAGQMLSGKSLHFGGPLSGPIVAIHGTVELAEAEAGKGIFMAAQRDHIEALLQTDQPHPYRLIVGHLGWTQEQLNHEISEGVWHRMPATADILRTDDGFLWPNLIRRATSHSVSRWLDTEHIADGHQLN